MRCTITPEPTIRQKDISLAGIILPNLHCHKRSKYSHITKEPGLDSPYCFFKIKGISLNTKNPKVYLNSAASSINLTLEIVTSSLLQIAIKNGMDLH